MDDPASLKPNPVREGVSTSGPERNWPMNNWWVAANSSELGSEPTMRWICEMPIALYRDESGKPVALHNRCPHRWAPLHRGTIEGDNLTCPYHGFQFAPSGQCVNVPTQDKTPTAIRVRSFPVEERHGFIWIWTGDVAKADAALIPDDLAYLTDDRWHVVWGYKSVDGNFMQMKENVLDLTHFAFLHKNSAQVTGWDRAPAVELSPGRVTYRQLFDKAPLPAIYAIPAGKQPGKPVDRDNWGTQLSPGAHHGSVDMYDPDPEPNGLERFSLRVIHLTTPVSIAKTHYYWAFARDHGDPFDYDAMRAQADIIFGEDIEMVEASQSMAQCSIDQEDAKEFSVAADRAAIEGRRLVAAMVKKEREEAAAEGR